MPFAPHRWSLATLQFPKTWINVYFSLVGLVTFVLGFVLSRTARNWTLGLWLINYEGGFVRRGLPGQIFFLLGRLLHVTPVFFVLLSCFLLYAVVLLCVRGLAMESSRNAWLMALILSPATFWFQILHPKNGFNKEIFFLATLSVFAVVLSKTHVSAVMSSSYMSVAIVLVVLSHEGMLFYEPYFFAALILSGRSARQALKECVAPALLGLATAWISSRYSGTQEIATQICSSLGYPFHLSGTSEICSGGAIAYITRSAEYARSDTLGSIRQFHFLIVFPCFAFLALLPAAGESFALAGYGMYREIRALWITVTVSFLGTLILFYYAYDWNRWIYIHLTSITILLLLLDGRVQKKTRIVAEPYRKMSMRQQAAAGGVFVLYSMACIAPNAVQAISLGFMSRWNHRLHLASFNPAIDSRPGGVCLEQKQIGCAQAKDKQVQSQIPLGNDKPDRA